MELELREAAIHRLEHGDVIVLKTNMALNEKMYDHISRSLNYLRDKIKEESGKIINFMILEAGMEMIHYRPVDREEVEES